MDKFLIKGPSKIKGQVFKYDNKCYKFTSKAESCNKGKKTVEFA